MTDIKTEDKPEIKKEEKKKRGRPQKKTDKDYENDKKKHSLLCQIGYYKKKNIDEIIQGLKDRILFLENMKLIINTA